MNSNELPIAILTDSYKAGHFEQYPDAEEMVAYGEFRKAYDGMDDDRLVFYGIRYIVENYLNRRWTVADVEAANTFYQTHNVLASEYPFPKDLFLSFVEEHDGHFPVTLEALPEGSVIYPHVPVYQITAKGKYARLVTFLETLLTQVWYPSTVATLSRHTRKLITEAFEKSVEEEFNFLIPSRLHDFGFRGTTSVEQSVLGGLAHLLSFEGSDTMSAAYYGQFYLNGGTPIASSIPATEHSVMTAWETELSAVLNMAEKYGDGLFATVADSYDYDNFLATVLPVVAPIVKRKGGTHVIRPDSGDPVSCVLRGLEACAKHYGYTINSKGYKVLKNSAVIQGDGINYGALKNILEAVLDAGFSAQNVAFGMGSGLLHKLNRDTMSFATKLCHITYSDGTRRDVMKTPKTDTGKFSLPGKLQVLRQKGAPTTYPSPATWEDRLLETNALSVVYDCGPVEVKWQTFDEVRERLNTEWNKAPSRHDAVSGQLRRKIKKLSS
ncbi:MAG: nicotinate phosphoribosyltransferase [Candidatus Thorarchaeota archaeon]|jgi:nicotinamide phosphoribosyltransferase